MFLFKTNYNKLKINTTEIDIIENVKIFLSFHPHATGPLLRNRHS